MTGTVDLGALCSLIAAAPPGPWRAVGTEVYGPSPNCLWIADTGDAGAEDGGRAVAELIAAARTALPELVTELREARREVERLRAERDDLAERVATLRQIAQEAAALADRPVDTHPIPETTRED